VALTCVITYDISEDRRRARAAATIQTLGDRVQRSVYIATLPESDLAELTERLLDIIDPDTDSVHVFRQCGACWPEVVSSGAGHRVR
jgi:CRISPR-associated protein Cas2